MFRNIFAFEDEHPAWKEVLEQFPNHVPRFDNKDEVLEFLKKYATRNGSNPDHPELLHSITTLIDWEQIEKYLLPKIQEYDSKYPRKSYEEVDLSHNRFYHQHQSTENDSTNSEEKLEYKLHDYMNSRLNLDIHKELSVESRYNTLRYLFFHMKCGIYVMIRNNEVVIFCPFVNKDYINTWGELLEIDSPNGSVNSYLDERAHVLRMKREDKEKEKRQILPLDQWWANGNIICNQYTDGTGGESNQFWGDSFILQLKDMFAHLCRERVVPDCEFFINKRDYPQLKYNPIYKEPVEPYGFIFNRDDKDIKQDIPLIRHLYQSYLPIFSFYLSERFADIPIPPTEDWEAATHKVFPASFKYLRNPETNEFEFDSPRDLYTKKFECPWEKKVPTAFFRGAATGGGVTAKTNQRLHIAQLSYDWSEDPTKVIQMKMKDEMNPSREFIQSFPYLDAKITGWNLRDKKTAKEKMTFLRRDNFPFNAPNVKKLNFVEISKQSTYKYLIYAEGHCAACRYGFMMSLGSVILKVDSQCVADQMWYFPLLKPYYDHIPVKADYSNLQEILEWCHANDDKCREIAKNAQRLYYQFVSLEGILDYLQVLCYEISKRWVCIQSFDHNHFPKLYDRPLLKRNFPPNDVYCTIDKESIHRDHLLCTYCAELLKFHQEQKKDSGKKSVSYGTDQVRLIVDKQEEEEKRKLRRKRMLGTFEESKRKKVGVDDGNNVEMVVEQQQPANPNPSETGGSYEDGGSYFIDNDD